MEGAAKVKEIENKIKNAKVLKEQEMKAAKAALEKCKKVAEETRSKWNLMKQVAGGSFTDRSFINVIYLVSKLLLLSLFFYVFFLLIHFLIFSYFCFFPNFYIYCCYY